MKCLIHYSGTGADKICAPEICLRGHADVNIMISYMFLDPNNGSYRKRFKAIRKRRRKERKCPR